MKCRYYGTLQLHDGTEVVIRDKAAAEKINKEFEWLASEATDRATKHAIRAVQFLFALKLEYHCGWTTDRISKLLKDVAKEAELIVDGETSVIEDYIYGEDEWRPMTKRTPTKDGDYFCTDRDGDVCCCTWYGNHFVDEAGYDEDDIVAWKPMPKPWEFWKEESTICTAID